MHALGDAVGAVVAVGDGFGEHHAVGVEQAVVDGPGVDPDARGAAEAPDEGLEADEDLLEQGGEVPAQVAVEAHGAVLEAVHRLQGDPAVDDAAGHHPPARRADVDGGEDLAGRPVGAAHLRNAAATPASTGTCRPVVWDRSAEQRTKTAFATCSGSTSRLRRVRCA